MTRSPSLDHREVGDRAADLAVQPLGELGRLDRHLAAHRLGDEGGRAEVATTIPTMRACTRAWTTSVYRRPSRDSSAWRSIATAAGCRSAASWRSPSTRPASATTRAAGRSSAACRPRAATSSPRPSSRRCSREALARQVAQALEASGSDEVWEFGAGSGALAGAADWARSASACAATRSSRSRRRCARASARRRATFGDRVRWLDALPRRCAASSSATRCSTRCRSS